MARNPYALPDSPYLQDVVDFHRPEDGLPPGRIVAVARTADGRVWVGGTFGLCCLEDGRWQAVGEDEPRCTMGIASLLGVGDTLWVGTETGIARLEEGRWERWWHDAPAPTRCARALVADRDGKVWAYIQRRYLSPYHLWRYEGMGWAPAHIPGPDPIGLAPAAQGGILAVNGETLAHVTGDRYTPLPLPALPEGTRLTCVAACGDLALVGTSAGLVEMAGEDTALVFSPRNS